MIAIEGQKIIYFRMEYREGIMHMNEIYFLKNIKYEIRCPICGDNYQHHLSHAEVRDGEDSYNAEPVVRGDVISILFHGECGHVWELCLGFHKGETLIFVKTEDVNVSERIRFC